MAIYDANGTNFTEIGKVYDANGTTFTQIGKVYDNNGTTDSLIYSANYEFINAAAGVYGTGTWSFSHSYATASNSTSGVKLEQTASYGSTTFTNSAYIDVTNYSKVTFTFYVYRQSDYTTKWTFEIGSASVSGTYGDATATLTLDLSKITGNQRLKVTSTNNNADTKYWRYMQLKTVIFE